jgi:hypothetical protein
MAKGPKELAHELHDQGLRKQLAREVARHLADPDAAVPAEVTALAGRLRELATRIEGDVTAEHAEPHASARAAASPAPDAAEGRQAIPPHRRARPRARRN